MPCFLAAKPDFAYRNRANWALTQNIEEVQISSPGALVWNISRKNVTKSKPLRIVGTDLYNKMTVRNVNTVRKLVELSSAWAS